MEDVIINMREKHIDITTEPRSNIFKVSYQGDSPKKVLLVTNAIAGKFIEENMRFREERTIETSEYIKQELRMAKTGLDEKEKVMRDYKLKYYNEMPEQRQANISRINALQEQYQSIESNAQSLEQTKALVLEQISLRKEMLAQAQILDSQATTQAGLLGTSSALGIDDQENITEIRRSLETLRAKYTDQHPDVKRLKNRLEKRENNKLTSESGTQQPESVQELTDPQVAQLEIQLKEITYNINRLKTERKELRKQIEQFTQWAEAAPIREAEWSALTRQYDQLKQHYEMLVVKSLDAESAKTLEQRQQGSQFKIVDSARLPEKPFKPDFMRIMMIAAALGLGIGFGGSYILESQDTSFKVATDIESFLNLPVICSIPLIQSAADKKKDRMKTITWATVLIVSTLAIVAEIIYLWQQGTIII
jgi:polysaccharide chain length determinant protein (PEP-CTERM system associated)